ncbi:MAG: Na/Pi cotransporter family protein [Bacteroidales bacterium]|nr:Na/Pi cotransporter family protein [Bacteroidales bacterium]
MVLSILTLVGALGLFLYGMNLMSSGLQKAAGSGLRKFLSSITSNPVKGVVTGMGVTAVIQSSSATTVMVVGFVNAGLLTLTQAISVIMGANIGTTFTAWIIALFGFKADVSILAVPLMALGFILSVSKKGRWRDISEFVVGFSLLFLGLSFMKNSVPDLQSSPEVLQFLQSWSGHGALSVLLFVLVGSVLTLILQSSSATVALTLIFLNMGWIQFDMAAAMVLGENIGTTITANIAASVGNPNARRAALAHTVFNIFGVIWAIILFRPFLSLIQFIISCLGLGASEQAPLYSISMLHTVFNLINTTLLIWFIPMIEKFVCAVIKDREGEERPEKLVYINAGLIPTPELAVAEAEKEVLHFGSVMHKGLEHIKMAVENSGNEGAFRPWKDKLVKYEEISDRIEYEVVNFLNKVSRDHLSDDTKLQIKSLYRIVGELESLGDSGDAISRLIDRAIQHGQKLSKEHEDGIYEMITLVEHAYDAMEYNLKNSATIRDIDNAIDAEISLNKLRDKLRDSQIENLDKEGEKYFEVVFFLSLVEALEKMGDYIINISQSVFNWRRGTPDLSRRWDD